MKGKKSNSIPAFAEIKTSNGCEQLANDYARREFERAKTENVFLSNVE